MKNIEAAKTMPAIPKTIRPPFDNTFPSTDFQRSGLPIWKGSLKWALVNDKLSGATGYTPCDNNAWWVHFINERSIVVYCKENELTERGLVSF
jgi:hypothetical protein